MRFKNLTHAHFTGKKVWSTPAGPNVPGEEVVLRKQVEDGVWEVYRHDGSRMRLRELDFYSYGPTPSKRHIATFGSIDQDLIVLKATAKGSSHAIDVYHVRDLPKTRLKHIWVAVEHFRAFANAHPIWSDALHHEIHRLLCSRWGLTLSESEIKARIRDIMLGSVDVRA